jgi:hypothetical protein
MEIFGEKMGIRGKQEDIMRSVGDTEKYKEINGRYKRSGKVYGDPCKIQGYEEDKREIHRSKKDNVSSEEDTKVSGRYSETRRYPGKIQDLRMRHRETQEKIGISRINTEI